MGGKDAAKPFRQLQEDILVPIHYESWHHFTQFGTELRKVFEEEGISDKICWLEPGQKQRVI
jgi:L-ascorbate metabolism protein UlaG (beta-lactamase superfamily)